MSLKITHSVVIILSILLLGFFSKYMIESNLSNASTFSILGLFAMSGLIYYLFSIIKKFKTL